MYGLFVQILLSCIIECFILNSVLQNKSGGTKLFFASMLKFSLQCYIGNLFCFFVLNHFLYNASPVLLPIRPSLRDCKTG